MKINIKKINMKRFLKPCAKFAILSSIVLGTTACGLEEEKKVETKEVETKEIEKKDGEVNPVETNVIETEQVENPTISLGESKNPLKFLLIKKDEEIAIGFGYFRFKSKSKTAELYFDNALTKESINLTKIVNSSNANLYWTEAGDYLPLQSVIDNKVSTETLNDFINNRSKEQFRETSWHEYCYYNDKMIELIKYFTPNYIDKDLDCIVSEKSLVKTK